MLYKRKGSRFYWVMFRDPKRPGKFIRQSTETDDYQMALEIEKSVALAIRGKVQQGAMERILKAIYGAEQGRVGMRLDEAWVRYKRVQDQRGKMQSAKTVTNLKSELDKFVDWAKTKRGLELIKDVSSEAAFAYADWMKKNGSVRECMRGEELKDKTRKNKIAGLSAIWSVLAGIEPEIQGDVWRNCVPIVRDSERGEAFTRAQEAAILKAARESEERDWELVCLVARWTGLRKVDVFKLTTDMVDFERGVIELTPSKTREYKIAVKIPMVSVLRAALERHFAAGKPGKVFKFGKAINGGVEYVFPKFAYSYPNDPEEVTFGEILKRAGVKGRRYTFHSYRHTFRTRLKEAGVPNELAKELGGWTQDRTLERYNHAEENEQLRAQMEKAV